MSTLNKLANLLAEYVEDAMPVAETEIRQFAQEHNIFLRDDYLHFLMKFGCAKGKRLEVFRRYGGSFGFEKFKRIYLDDIFEPGLPEGHTYFGSDFIDYSFCIENETGKIYTFDEGERYCLVHESLDGFLLNCLLKIDDEKIFANKAISRDMNADFITEFREKIKQIK